jgi:hypothetical protein
MCKARPQNEKLLVSMCEQGETCTIGITEEFYLTKCIRSHQNNFAWSLSSRRPWVNCQDKIFTYIEKESCGCREEREKNPFKM